jgi:sterol desaturase/sphingolipid hydroxylase (fatty acid hydroxylase superfamily)
MWPFALRFKEIRLLVACVVASAAWLVMIEAPPLRALMHAGIAAASWFVIEYLFHRFALHFPNRWLSRVNVHWMHHKNPSAPELVFTPWWALALLVAGTAAVGSLTEGQLSAAGAALGMSAILVLYESTHLAAHVPYKPRTRWGAYMKRYHQLHHFQNERYWFGVTHPVGDLLFGTWPDPKTIERSPTARTLGVAGANRRDAEDATSTR